MKYKPSKAAIYAHQVCSGADTASRPRTQTERAQAVEYGSSSENFAERMLV